MLRSLGLARRERSLGNRCNNHTILISRTTIWCLGFTQLVSWGISYYLIGIFGEKMLTDLGWTRPIVYGGFSFGLVVMGGASPLVGRAIDRYGGRYVLAGGSICCAIGCLMLAHSHSITAYYSAWLVLGLAMRATLYEAAFTALVRIGGQQARRPIAKITLLGGLASTCFWPIGHFLDEVFGWRGAVNVYAVIALVILPFYFAVPNDRNPSDAFDRSRPTVPPQPRSATSIAALYALIAMLSNGLNSAMSAHMVGILSELGLAAALAVTVSSLRGIGQSSARLAEILFGRRLHPVALNLLATIVMPLCFAAGLAGGRSLVAAVAFTFMFGASTGILTITRGTLPLVLFDAATYGAYVGKLLVPGFLCAAASPLIFAAVIEHFGAKGALYVFLCLALVMFALSFVLRVRTKSRAAP
jgi:predicted MFS family arabinose efflux permease